MNSLNIISARVSPPPSPGPSRSNSLTSISLAALNSDAEADETTGVVADALRSDDESELPQSPASPGLRSPRPAYLEADLVSEPDEFVLDDAISDVVSDGRPAEEEDLGEGEGRDMPVDEKTPLLSTRGGGGGGDYDGTHFGEAKVLSPVDDPAWMVYPKRFANAVMDSIRWLLSALTAPGVWLWMSLYDDTGKFAPLSQIRRVLFYREDDEPEPSLKKPGKVKPGGRKNRRLANTGSTSSSLSSESESDPDRRRQRRSASGKHPRTKSDAAGDDSPPTGQRSIRIKLQADEALRQRKANRKAQQSRSASSSNNAPDEATVADISAQLKSPTSPSGAGLTKYPKTPAPPRPLIPRRQPSYIKGPEPPLGPGGRPQHQKTLILDLDETLIHSMSKGGRMSSGHMVEVRLNTTYVGVGGQATIGPQHPILYYVHKRPHCDEFLRRVSKWYNLVVFTASVQEYADPVIDWLEADRKYFSARYYRQHYNAIPIQGWISDPTDSDLMYLIPFLEGMQYVSDVRALLGLRGGEDGTHIA
ncbi:putative nuclear envelope morphology protein [Thermochaetoides thermophila DSM 1495]|uniref:Mitochondrial import inner membrane translocase subunit TIM50 n=1 Tax=Chaetomium thermophilum (strain DSM 1495 / CBS 144.50 / IMI 039719) TaxID=759272 RepID=G0SEE3_CHATD|nr:putative nuclear envelope morphology protein [Thermochaetoides thermophila DSM 1495]EGS18320.1 putative nuclear envelope morphology protein [Thermochaetoides thermophila DSM 1495]